MDKKPFPERLESDRLLLKMHDPAFAETMFGFIDGDRERLRVFLPWVDATKSVEDTRAYLQKTRDGHGDGTLVGYGLFDPRTGLYLGNAGMHAIQWEHRCIELGYWLLGRFEGMGFMSEAVRLLERACFDLGFHRVEIRCSSANARSAAVPRRLGYRLDGTLRENALEHGQYRDTLVFGKLNPAQ